MIPLSVDAAISTPSLAAASASRSRPRSFRLSASAIRSRMRDSASRTAGRSTSSHLSTTASASSCRPCNLQGPGQHQLLDLPPYVAEFLHRRDGGSDRPLGAYRVTKFELGGSHCHLLHGMGPLQSIHLRQVIPVSVAREELLLISSECLRRCFGCQSSQLPDGSEFSGKRLDGALNSCGSQMSARQIQGPYPHLPATSLELCSPFLLPEPHS